MITIRDSYPLVADIVISASEIDTILLSMANAKFNKKDDYNRKRVAELSKSFQLIRDAMSLRTPKVNRIGSTDESRLNWK